MQMPGGLPRISIRQVQRIIMKVAPDLAIQNHPLEGQIREIPEGGIPIILRLVLIITQNPTILRWMMRIYPTTGDLKETPCTIQRLDLFLIIRPMIRCRAIQVAPPKTIHLQGITLFVSSTDFFDKQ